MSADTARVEVRVVDLYELVRYFYGTSRSFARPATGLAADRCNVALCGVPRIDLILKAHAAEHIDGSRRASESDGGLADA